MTKKQLSEFENAIPQLEAELNKRKHKWTYSGPVDFDDVKSQILIHFFKKWPLYDKTKPLKNWANRIISNQLNNISRDNIRTYLPPCASCPHFITENSKCDLYDEPNSNCDLYKKWTQSKKYGANINLPVSMENHISEIFCKHDTSYDLEDKLKKIISYVKMNFSEEEFSVFELFYIEGLSELDIAKKKKIKTFVSNKNSYSKKIMDIRKKIFAAVKLAIVNGDIE